MDVDVLSYQESDSNSFRSNVSRLKSRFLQPTENCPRLTSLSATVSSRLQSTSLISHGINSSPEIQRRVSATATSTWSTRQPSVSVDRDFDKTEDSAMANTASVLDIADHVERFKHTRALFAQLAQQSNSSTSQPRTQQLRQIGGVRSSPPPASGRLSMMGAPSRTMSPSNVSPTPDAERTVPVMALLRKTAAATGQCISSTSSCSMTYQPSSSSLCITRPVSGGDTVACLNVKDVISPSCVSSSRIEPENRHSLESTRRRVVETNDVTSSVVLRRNARQSIETSSSISRAVLLPKRRSREEKTMASKEELEASLCHADEYWRRQRDYVGTDCQSPTVDHDVQIMSESTFSSGSGEEMARSDSGHDLSVINDGLTSPMISSAANVWPQCLSSTGVDLCQVVGDTVDTKGSILSCAQCNVNGLCPGGKVGSERNSVIECNGVCDDAKGSGSASVVNNSQVIFEWTANNGCFLTHDYSVMERSSADSEVMKGSVTDCDCKDVGTEKQPNISNSLKINCPDLLIRLDSAASLTTSIESESSKHDLLPSLPSVREHDESMIPSFPSVREHDELMTINCPSQGSLVEVSVQELTEDDDCVQDMSVSEDEDSGDTDYVLLGQPVMKKLAVNSETSGLTQKIDDTSFENLPVVNSVPEAFCR